MPLDFTFPSGDMQLAWGCWCCGNQAELIGPLRRLAHHDLTTPALRKRLSDYRFLVCALEAKAVDLGVWIPHPTLAQAAAMLTPVLRELGLPDHATRGRVRRLCAMRWSSMVNLLRSHQRRGVDAAPQ